MTTVVSTKALNVLEAVKVFRNSCGYSPSLRELGDALKMNPGSIHYHLSELERHGFIKTIPNTSRSITFVDDNIAFTEDEISIINALFPHSKFVVVKHLNDIVNKMNKYKRPGGKFKALGLLNKRLKNIKVKVD